MSNCITVYLEKWYSIANTWSFSVLHGGPLRHRVPPWTGSGCHLEPGDFSGPKLRSFDAQGPAPPPGRALWGALPLSRTWAGDDRELHTYQLRSLVRHKHTHHIHTHRICLHTPGWEFHDGTWCPVKMFYIYGQDGLCAPVRACCDCSEIELAQLCEPRRWRT